MGYYTSKATIPQRISDGFFLTKCTCVITTRSINKKSLEGTISAETSSEEGPLPYLGNEVYVPPIELVTWQENIKSPEAATK